MQNNTTNKVDMLARFLGAYNKDQNGKVTYKHFINNDNIIVETTCVHQLDNKHWVLVVYNDKVVYLQPWQKLLLEKNGKPVYAVKLCRDYWKTYKFSKAFAGFTFKQEVTFDSLVKLAQKQDAQNNPVEVKGSVYHGFKKKHSKKYAQKTEEEVEEETTETTKTETEDLTDIQDEQETTVSEPVEEVEEQEETEESEVESKMVDDTAVLKINDNTMHEVPLPTNNEEELEEPEEVEEEPEEQPQEEPKHATSAEERTPEMMAFVNQTANDLRNFCKDFALEIDPREINHMAHCADQAEMATYLCNITELLGMDSALVETAKNKCESPEFANIVQNIQSIEHPKAEINKRLTIMYGEAGTGKTTKAVALFPNAKRLVASATDSPDDLFTTYNPTTNSYEKTELAKAMEEGTAIIIDEANFWNDETWGRLQGVLDNTICVYDRGQRIDIKDGFEMILTMNLETNFGKRPLRSPIVSRAKKIERFDSSMIDYNTYVL